MGTLITTAGIIAIIMLNWTNEVEALTICTIVGGILTIPGAFFGVLASGWGLSLKILFSSTLGELFNNVITSAIIWAIRFFFLPYIVAVIIFVIAA